MRIDELIAELQEKLAELKRLTRDSGLDASPQIAELAEEVARLSLGRGAWEQVQLARHPSRPTTMDYLGLMMDDFYELHGDRLGSDDGAIVAGLAKFAGRTVVVVGHQKGKNLVENRIRRSGMAGPGGYRKAARIMGLGERYGFPIIALIDTPGAYPGVKAEEHNIGGAIADSIYTMLRLRTPIVAVVIGEGGSGGALGIGVGDRLLMMENAYYSVISPEGCAAILWGDRSRAREAAAALRLTAHDLLDLGVIDEVVQEPTGGAHTDPQEAARSLGEALRRHMDELRGMVPGELPGLRRSKFRGMGICEGAVPVMHEQGGE
ncbi:MAG: acetyl-CoA carboxylase carboxyltransferase subunit alpha [Candidatus Bipolaricaulota bacterium]|jgi:acetyl-CoA carboxylase carboxyl transferase subunit alpha